MAKDDTKEKAPGEDTPAGINPKYLKDIMFTGAKPEEVKVDGVKKTRHTPFRRACTPDDVLDWKDRGAFVSIVTKDGQKYRVPK